MSGADSEGARGGTTRWSPSPLHDPLGNSLTVGGAPQAAGMEDGLRRRSPIDDARASSPGLADTTMCAVSDGRSRARLRSGRSRVASRATTGATPKTLPLPFRVFGEALPEAVQSAFVHDVTRLRAVVPRRSLQVGQLLLIMARTLS
jgi:hypothetical protein